MRAGLAQLVKRPSLRPSPLSDLQLPPAQFLEMLAPFGPLAALHLPLPILSRPPLRRLVPAPWHLPGAPPQAAEAGFPAYHVARGTFCWERASDPRGGWQGRVGGGRLHRALPAGRMRPQGVFGLDLGGGTCHGRCACLLAGLRPS